MGFRYQMKKLLILLIFLISCNINSEMKNIFGFSSIIYISQISDIFPSNRNFLILDDNRCKVQYRFQIDKQNWDIGERINNTYVTINSIKYKLSDILIDTKIVLKKTRDNEIKIDNKDIEKYNTGVGNLYGKIIISETEGSIYITIGWIDLKFGKYSFIDIVNNDNLIYLNPELIIGISNMQ